jgi:hypothetical protein
MLRSRLPMFSASAFQETAHQYSVRFPVFPIPAPCLLDFSLLPLTVLLTDQEIIKRTRQRHEFDSRRGHWNFQLT